MDKLKTRLASVVIAITLQRLLEGQESFGSFEEKLVIEAVQRSTRALNDASLSEIKDYVGAMTADQAQGFLNNVKGIYHELLVAHAENIDGDEVSARIHETTNYPGSDIEFVVDGEVVEAIQLKATDNYEYVQQHLDAYPDIRVQATEEVAALFPNVESSGYSNAFLTEHVESVARDNAGNIEDAVGTSVLYSAAIQAGTMLTSGKVSPAKLKGTMKDIAVGGGTSAILSLLIG